MTALKNIPNVELLEVGEEWETSTGVFTWTLEDVESAVASQDDPAVRTPILKFGHVDPRFNIPDFDPTIPPSAFDGQPAIGKVTNIRLSEDRLTVLGDYTGVPAWLADIIPSAYPRRSIEGLYDWPSATGQTHPFVITAVSLLGTAYPAITTLEDIQALYDGTIDLVEVSDEEVVAATMSVVEASGFVRAVRGERVPNLLRRKAAAAAVAAAVDVETLRRTFYEDPDLAKALGYWAWIRAVYLDPAEVIVDDDEGGLWRLSYTVTGDDVTFGEPQAVKIQYVDVAATVAASSGNPGPIATYATKEASRPATVRGNRTETGQEADVKLSEENIRALGLDPAAATEADINSALVSRLSTTQPDTGEGGDDTTETEKETTETETAPVVPAPAPEGVPVPEGMVLVDASAWETVARQAAQGASVAAAAAVAARDAHIEAAVRAGKFPRARMAHYAQAWDADPKGTKDLIDKLAPGLVPVSEVGVAASGEDGSSPTDYPADWAPRRAAAPRSSRVTRTGTRHFAAQD